MHACGHDAHMAMLLGLGELIAPLELDLGVLLVFEPAEETLGGAQYIVCDPAYTNTHPVAVYALHLDPTLPLGMVGTCAGIMTAQDADLDIEVFGQSAHGTTPEDGKNALLAASHIAQTLSALTHIGGTLNDALATIGTLRSGEGRNIIASYAHLEGTLRAYQPEVFEHLKDTVFDVALNVETLYGVKVKTSIQTLHPPVMNDPVLTRTLANHLTFHPIAPRLIAEDFSYFQHHTPGVFLMLGTKDDVYPNEQLHKATFNFTETVLREGVHTYLTLLKMHLEEPL